MTERFAFFAIGILLAWGFWMLTDPPPSHYRMQTLQLLDLTKEGG